MPAPAAWSDDLSKGSRALLRSRVQITCKRLQDRVEALEAGPTSGGGRQQAKQGGGRREGKPRWLNNRAVASAALLATTIANGQGPLMQFARIASLLCILRNER